MSPALAAQAKSTSSVTASSLDVGVRITTSIDVVVGIIEDSAGLVLINRRLAGTHMSGWWEFPGGKRRQHEEPLAALRRELFEELRIDVIRAAPFLQLSHDYPDRRVNLDIWSVAEYSGTPTSAEGQSLRWVSLEELSAIELLAADRPIVEALRVRRFNSATT